MTGEGLAAPTSRVCTFLDLANIWEVMQILKGKLFLNLESKPAMKPSRGKGGGSLLLGEQPTRHIKHTELPLHYRGLPVLNQTVLFPSNITTKLRYALPEEMHIAEFAT